MCGTEFKEETKKKYAIYRTENGYCRVNYQLKQCTVFSHHIEDSINSKTQIDVSNYFLEHALILAAFDTRKELLENNPELFL